MNKTQAKELNTYVSAINDAINFIEALRDELQETFDDKSEHWQESNAGTVMQNHIDILDDAASSLDSVYDALSEVEAG